VDENNDIVVWFFLSSKVIIWIDKNNFFHELCKIFRECLEWPEWNSIFILFIFKIEKKDYHIFHVGIFYNTFLTFKIAKKLLRHGLELSTRNFWASFKLYDKNVKKKPLTMWNSDVVIRYVENVQKVV
jgi:hypothetical protein